MTVREALQKTTKISYPTDGRPVDKTVAEALRAELAPQARAIADSPQFNPQSAIRNPQSGGVLHVLVADEVAGPPPKGVEHQVPADGDWMFFQIRPSGGGTLMASSPYLLYGLYGRLKEDWLDEDVARFEEGEVSSAAFRWCPNWSLTREIALIGRGFDRESYVRECARLGYSHMAVNGLTTLFIPEPWTEGEVYPVFYRHGPALDQFVSSRLNKGIYPEDYLRANLTVLKRNAELVVRYGMTPGLMCIEPRSVPEEFFRRYPMLRGARVDHPFRSFRPRYNPSIVHPVVQEHYAELMQNLLEEVPELGYLLIGSNDSGAAFEFTRRMYAGRNGGAYLIREWKSDEEIAEAAGRNVIHFLQVLRNAAEEVHTGFRVIFGVGCVNPERHIVWRGFGAGIDPGDSLESLPKEAREELAERGSLAHVSAPIAAGFRPLVGIPSPWLTYENLKRLVEEGIEVLMSAGEVADPSMAPWSVNHEVWRAVHLSWPVDVDEMVKGVAARWVGADLADRLVEAWRGADVAVRSYQPRLVLWADDGFIPYRLWVRPLIPDIEQISEEDRAYYEAFMLSVPNNPTRVDLSRDVLFDLNTPEEALEIVRQLDAQVWEPLDGAIRVLSETASSLSEEDPAREVFVDQRDRLRGLRCWLRTQRSVAAWIAGVPGYLQAEDEATKLELRQLLREMVIQEIENTRDLLELWETSSVEFMVVSTEGENVFMYGENLGDLLRRRIELMAGHEEDEPYIDPDFMWRVPGIEWKSKCQMIPRR